MREVPAALASAMASIGMGPSAARAIAKIAKKPKGSKYQPHQGKRERARRMRQLAKQA